MTERNPKGSKQDTLKPHGSAPTMQINDLTRRQFDIAHLVAQGCTNKQIEAHLRVSRGTVHRQIRTIYSRLHISPSLNRRVMLANKIHLAALVNAQTVFRSRAIITTK